ncbi:MAG: SCO2524 family protein, partial [Stackebrandtia sp.]
MKFQPRQQLLEVWRSLIRTSYRDGKWRWAGGDEPDSVTNAQQMLCLMSPVMEIHSLRFNRPDETHEDVASALRGLGDAVEAPRTLIQILTEYYELHRI